MDYRGFCRNYGSFLLTLKDKIYLLPSQVWKRQEIQIQEKYKNFTESFIFGSLKRKI